MKSDCATRAQSANPLRGSSAPLRHGEAPLGNGTGRPWLRPNLRYGLRPAGPSSDRALRPHHSPSPAAKLRQPRVAPLRARVPKGHHDGAQGPGG